MRRWKFFDQLGWVQGVSHGRQWVSKTKKRSGSYCTYILEMVLWVVHIWGAVSSPRVKERFLCVVAPPFGFFGRSCGHVGGASVSGRKEIKSIGRKLPLAIQSKMHLRFDMTRAIMINNDNMCVYGGKGGRRMASNEWDGIYI